MVAFVNYRHRLKLGEGLENHRRHLSKAGWSWGYGSLWIVAGERTFSARCYSLISLSVPSSAARLAASR
jgi:hypothetical protein